MNIEDGKEEVNESLESSEEGSTEQVGSTPSDMEALATMSDEDIMKLSDAEVIESIEAKKEEEESSEENSDEEKESSNEESEEEGDNPHEEVVDDEDDKNDDDEDEPKELDEDDIVESEEDENENEDEDENSEGIELTDSQKIDAIFETLETKNGDIEIKSVDEVRTLMRQGASYTQKMQALAPHLKTVRTLENAKINDPETLNFLIDLKQGNLSAIRRLLSDHKIDSLSLSDDENENNPDDYVPNQHQASDGEMAMDAVLAKIESSPAYNRTIQIVGNEWDTETRQRILDRPSDLEIINEHVDNGVYDVVNNEITRRKALGQLNGLAYYDAYIAIGKEFDEQGKFNHLVNGKTGTSKGDQQKPGTKMKKTGHSKTRTKGKSNAEIDKRKKSAASSSTGKNKGSSVKPDFNPLSMGDDEFMKQYGSQLA